MPGTISIPRTWTLWNTAAILDDVKPGDVIDDRFEIERLSGVGGMGAVFRAIDRASGVPVAVKVLLERQAHHAARFSRESRALAELSHPGIVRHVAHGLTPSRDPYLAMEWLEGEDLMTRLSQKGLSVEESVNLGRRVAEALGAAHARGVVHRDLKPTNLFLVDGDPGQVKLLDFGIAQLGDATRMTQAGTLLGTPGYMAPEQARSEQTIDARADVFSLGCVLFECLTKEPVFRGDHLMAILAKILFDEPPRVRDLRPDVPPHLDALVARMLAKEPGKRPRDGAAVAEALASPGAMVSPPPSTAAPSTPASTLTGGERRALSIVLLGREETARSAEAETREQTAIVDAERALRVQAEAYGARLTQLSDGSMVVTMSSPMIATDQAAQAARCALALRRFAWGRLMAIATGRCESTGRMMLGDAIDRAAALLARRAPPSDATSSIAIDEVTRGLLDARFEVREGGGDEGLSLLGEREIADGARTLLGKVTPCVGRDRELALLEHTFAECVEDGVSHAALVVARAGMGKSRLAHEFMKRIRQRAEPCPIWIGRGDSLHAGAAFGLLGQALRGACGIVVGEPLDVRRAKLLARVAEHVPAGEAPRVAAFIGEIVGTPLPDEDSVALRAARRDATLMGDQMRRAFEDFLVAECAAQPVLLVLEDLHWGDLPTVRFIDGALGALKDTPWMVLALARPEVHELFPRLWQERRRKEFSLKELNRKASERLTRQVLGDQISRETLDHIVAQADGNAFYLEELIRATAGRRGNALPETVVAMVQSRLSALGGESRRLLRAASVFGEVFWTGGVSSLLGDETSSAKVGKELTALVEQEVLARRPESRFPGEQEFTFRHALLREGAYEMLTDTDRALGHRLTGAWLEAHGEGNPLVLAEHFVRGGETARAGRLYVRAVEQAHYGGDSSAAISLARQAIACDLPEEVRLELLGTLCIAYVYRADLLGGAMPDIEETLRLASPGSSPWARAASAKLVAAMHRDDRGMFLETLAAVRQVDPAPEATLSVAVALVNCVNILDGWGQIKDADAILGRLQAIVAPVAESDLLSASFLGTIQGIRAAYRHEDPFSGHRWAEITIARAEEACYGRGAIAGRVLIGMNLWFLGALERAESTLRSIATDESEAGGPAVHRALSLSGVLADRGALAEAQAIATKVVASASGRRHRFDEGLARRMLGDVIRRGGDLDAAEREARAAIDLLATVPLHQVPARATLAAVLLAQGRTTEARAAAEEAMAQYTSIGACGLFRGAFLRLVHAECLWAAGEDEAARQAISLARDRILDGAAKIGDIEYRRTFLEGVPENARTLTLAAEGSPMRLLAASSNIRNK